MLSSNFEIPKSLFNSSSLSGLSLFSVFLFSRSYSSPLLHLFCSPLLLSSPPSSLSTIIGVLVFVLFWAPSLSFYSKSRVKWLMLVLRTCPFPSKPPSFSVMALTSIDPVFWGDFWWCFLGRFGLTWRWMLVPWLDLLSRSLGRYLAMVIVFFFLL